MKKVLIFTIMLLAGFGITRLSTVDAQAPATSTTTTVYEGTYAGVVSGYESYTYTLLAGQSIYAGTVTMTTDGVTLFVTVDGISDLDSIHIYLYEDGQTLPTKRPVPGQAPYKLENISGTSATLALPLSEALSYVLAVHVSFDAMNDSGTTVSTVAGQTGYAAEEDANFSGKGAWFYLVRFNVVEATPVVAPTLYVAAHAALTNSETAWALGSTSFIDAGISNKWGWYVDVNTYGVSTFDIYYGAGRNNLSSGTLIGTLTVDYHQDYVVVTYTLTQPLLDEVQLYVGFEAPTSAVPGSYDYKTTDLNGVYSYSFTVLFEDLA